jgi:hypothetical protein
MTIIERQATAAYQYADYWRALMPDVEEPGEDTFLMWAGCYTEKQVSRGISGAARKLRAMRTVRQPMTANDVLSYAASIMRNEAMGVRRFGR